MSTNLAEIVNAENMRADVRKLREAREAHDKIALELEIDRLFRKIKSALNRTTNRPFFGL